MSDWRSHLLALAHGINAPITGVTDVTGVIRLSDTGQITPPNPCHYVSYGYYASDQPMDREGHSPGVTTLAAEPAVEIDAEERAAMVQYCGGIPAQFAGAFGQLQVAPPAGCKSSRWLQAIDDAGYFLDRWGRDAKRLGWSAAEIIGPVHTSLAWALCGQHVVSLTVSAAMLSDGRVFHRACNASQAISRSERRGHGRR